MAASEHRGQKTASKQRWRSKGQGRLKLLNFNFLTDKRAKKQT